MNRRIKLHLLLFLLMYAVFAISTLIYRKEYSIEEWLHVALVYGIYVLILFSINIIKKRWIKWIIFGGIFFFPISYLILVGTNLHYVNSLDALLASAPINVPFLPKKINYPSGDPILINFVFYVLYFLLPLIYWYGLYSLSKRIITTMNKNKRRTNIE